MAFPVGWGHRVAITIDHDQIDGDLTDWTMVFTQDFDSVLTSVNGPLDADGDRASINGGGDIRFSSDAAGQTQLACDIRYWVTNNTPGSATCEVAVKVPNVSSSTDTTIYMWWGKSGETQPSASDTYGQYNAYDSDYELVFTAQEALPLGSDVIDRTSNQWTGTSYNLSSGERLSGKIGYAYDCYDNNEYVRVNGFYASPSNAMGIECVAYFEQITSPPNGWSLTGDLDSSNWGCYCGTTDSGATYPEVPMGRIGGTSVYAASSSTWGDNEWHYVAAVAYDSSNYYSYGDDDYKSASQATGSHSASRWQMELGSRVYNGDVDHSSIRGHLDETRIYNGPKSSAFVIANYRNLFNVTDFLTWGSIVDVDELGASEIASATSIETPTLGQIHTLESSEIASATSIESPTLGQVHALESSEISCTISVETPTVGQVHALEATEISSATSVETPSIGQIHALGAGEIASTTSVESPIIGQEHVLGASEIASATSIETPTLGQIHTLESSEIASTTSIETPTVGQVHALEAAEIASAISVESPTVGQEHVLGASEIASAVSVETPTVGQVHTLEATEISSATSVETPTCTHVLGLDELEADEIASTTSIETPTVGQVHALEAAEIASAISVESPTLGQTHALESSEISSATSVETPTLSQVHVLVADEISSTTSLETPTAAHVHTLEATEISCTTSIETPTLGQVHALDASDITCSVSIDSPSTGQTHDLSADSLSVTITLGIPGGFAAGADDNVGVAVRTMRQTAVYWAPEEPDDFGQPTYNSPVEISCRWDDVQEQFIGPNGDQELSKAQLIVDRDLAIKGMILLGDLSAVTNQGDPRENDNVWEIRSVSKTPNFRGSRYLREVFL